MSNYMLHEKVFDVFFVLPIIFDTILQQKPENTSNCSKKLFYF